MFNNRANRSLQDLQTQSQREKLGAHAPHISRGAISHTPHTAQKHTTSASRSRYSETIRADNTPQQRNTHRQRRRQRAAAPKETGAKIEGARRQRLEAQSLKRQAAQKAGGQNTASAQRRGARSHSLKRTKAGGETLRQSGGNTRAKLIFLFNAYGKIQNTFYPLVYFGKNRRLFGMPLWIFLRNIRKICAKYAKKW